MTTSRRDFLRVSSLAGAAAGLGVVRPGIGTAHPATSAGPSPARVARGSLRILVLGGTGFIGPYQVRYALERGHEVTLFNRGRTDADLFPDLETLIGDRDDDLEALRGRSWDVVLDNSGFYPRWVRESAELLEDSVERYLFVSSISAYDASALGVGDDEFGAPLARMDDPTDESESPYGPGYGARKAECERALVDVFGAERSVVVRPGQITGPGDPTDRVRYWLARVERGGEILVPGDPDDPVQLIDARDLSAWVVRLLEQGAHGPFNGTGPRAPLTMAGFVHAARSVVSSDLSFTWVAEPFLSERELVGRYVLPWAPTPMQALTQLSLDRAWSTGLTYRPLARTLMDMRDELRAAGPGGIDPELFDRLGVSPEREAEALAEWHARAG